MLQESHFKISSFSFYGNTKKNEKKKTNVPTRYKSKSRYHCSIINKPIVDGGKEEVMGVSPLTKEIPLNQGKWKHSIDWNKIDFMLNISQSRNQPL